MLSDVVRCATQMYWQEMLYWQESCSDILTRDVRWSAAQISDNGLTIIDCFDVWMKRMSNYWWGRHTIDKHLMTILRCPHIRVRVPWNVKFSECPGRGPSMLCTFPLFQEGAVYYQMSSVQVFLCWSTACWKTTFNGVCVWV